MKKGAILVSVVVLLGATPLAQAQEGELHGAANVTYQSKYVWRGFNCFGSSGAIQPSVDLDLYGTGFGFSVMGHIPLSGGNVNLERYDYTLYYCNKVFEDETYATNYRLGWVYYNHPDNPSKGSATAPNAALQELQAVLSWPKVLGVEGLVPSYVIGKVWPSESGSWSGSRAPAGGSASGWGHVLMLDYMMSIPGLLPETPEQPLRFHTELVYNDGFHPCGGDPTVGPVDHDWSNVVFGAETDFDLGYNLTLTPGLYYQISMEDTVNDDDELWAILGLTYKF
ncbi:MAG: TorF family putative porin [Planctomycetota bacterium]